MTVRAATVAGLALAASAALAQQPAAPPSFAPANLGDKAVRAMAANCAACHGTNGRPVANSPVAGLAGRPREEIVEAMVAFRDGKRQATLMQQIAKGYSEAETNALADYFSKQPR